MRKIYLFLLTTFSLLIFTNLGIGQTTLVEWNFPTGTIDLTVDVASANNTSKAIVRDAVTSYTYSFSGGATTNSVSTSGWTSGMDSKYWEIEVNTTGFTLLKLSSKQRSSSGGPRDFKVQYKIGTSGSWTDIAGSVITVADNFTSGVLANIALPTAVENQSSVFFRWVMTSNTPVSGSGTVAGTGTSRIDDLKITGTASTGPCSTPSAPTALNIVRNSTNPTTALDLSFTAPTTPPSGYLVIRSTDNVLDFTFTDGNARPAVNATSGNDVVVADNTTTSFTNSSLTPGTQYYYFVVSYNTGCTGQDVYATSSLSGSNTTQPENGTINEGCASTSTYNLFWTPPLTGNYDGVVIVLRENAVPGTIGMDFSSLPAANTDFSAAPAVALGKLIYAGNATGASNLTVTGLTNNTSYTAKAYTYKNGTGTIYSNGTTISETTGIPNVSGASVTPASQQITVSYTLPSAACYDEVLVVAATASNTGVPTGTSYSANSTFGSGSALGNGFVVYQGNAAFQTITGLTNGTTYYFKIFLRKGTDWSTGYEISGSPLVPGTTFKQGELLLVGVAATGFTSSGACGGTTDRYDLLTLVDINPNTTITLTDNGYERGTAGYWGSTEGTWNYTYTGLTPIPAGNVIKLFGGSSSISLSDINTYMNTLNWNVSLTVSTLNGVLNMGSSSDQLYVMQGGTWVDGGSHLLSWTGGTVLDAFTSSGSWNTAAGGGSTSTSTLHPQIKCNPIIVNSIDYSYYSGPTTAASPVTWLSRIATASNWNTSATTCTDYTTGLITSGALASDLSSTLTWVGGVSGDVNNWFNCSNWSPSKVPNENDIVMIGVTNTYVAKVSAAANFSDYFNDTATCKTLSMSANQLDVSGSANNVIKVKGNIDFDGGVISADDASTSTMDGKILLAGNWNQTGGTFNAGNGTVIFNGTSSQNFVAGSITDFYKVEFSNPTNINLQTSMKVNNNALFTKGIVNSTAANLLVFSDDATAMGASNTSFVDGPVKKIGNDAFTFPVGDNNRYRMCAISAPSSFNDEFIAQYFWSTPVDASNLASTMDHISDLEYWDIHRNVGTSNVNVTLSWDANSQVNTSLDLRMAHYNSTPIWEDLGGTVNTTNSTITVNNVSNFSPFTLATSTPSQPLPIEFILFDVKKVNSNKHQLIWEMASQEQVEHYEVEFSKDGKQFSTIAAINANQNAKYSFSNLAVNTGENYYRIKAVIQEGIAVYSVVKTVTALKGNIFVYPNPVVDYIVIEGQGGKYQIFNVAGAKVKEGTFKNAQKIDLSQLPKGNYFLNILHKEQVQVMQLSKQ